MKYVFAIILCTVVCSEKLWAQSKSFDPDVYIMWNASNKLQWSDFEATNDDSRFGDAGTAVKIVAKPYYEKRRLYYNVFALFNKKKSWASDVNDRLLAHEQLHFDLAEVYARKIRKKVAELRRSKVKDLKIYNKAVKKILEESNQADELYDHQTLHGALPKNQITWEKKVARQLMELQDYSQ
ncbi:DUF922 domain-containing protein [Fulvivirga aurantia]|uniref:DUF922 domain-containing protein n=1 Tax=Fulvivirga aurantia TaxID=2529383 RepID=UPI0016295B9E|nr:DUF922 domain-containing protein [Fulvivirga aurantia]